LLCVLPAKNGHWLKGECKIEFLQAKETGHRPERLKADTPYTSLKEVDACKVIL